MSLRAKYPNARWFDALGGCAEGCGRNASGYLMSHRNDRIGRFCTRCADRLLKAAKRDQGKGGE